MKCLAGYSPRAVLLGVDGTCSDTWYKPLNLNLVAFSSVKGTGSVLIKPCTMLCSETAFRASRAQNAGCVSLSCLSDTLQLLCAVPVSSRLFLQGTDVIRVFHFCPGQIGFILLVNSQGRTIFHWPSISQEVLFFHLHSQGTFFLTKSPLCQLLFIEKHNANGGS